MRRGDLDSAGRSGDRKTFLQQPAKSGKTLTGVERLAALAFIKDNSERGLVSETHDGSADGATRSAEWTGLDDASEF